MAEIFMKFDPDIKGEAKEDKHKDWIQLESLGYSASMEVSSAKGSAGGASAGKVQHGDLVCSKFADLATAKLMELCSSGKHFKTVKIEFLRAGGDKVKYMEINLAEVLISSIQFGAGSGSDVGTDSLSLNYGKIEIIYTAQKREDGSGGGNVTGKFDLIAGKV